jgi:hypothetical protein
MSQSSEVERPAWSREPFAPGNALAVTHGANSPRLTDPIVAELVERLLADADVAYLRAPSYQPAILAWARAEARILLMAELLAKSDLPAKVVRSTTDQLHRAEASAGRARARLGLDPMSRAALMKQLAAGQYMKGLVGVRQAGLAALSARGLRSVPGGEAS